MKVLVTGANGFLGREVVRAFLEAGHAVRALVRPATRLDGLGWDERVEVFRADLRGGVELTPAFEGVDAVCHLATQMSGDDSGILSGTIVGTERLLRAMAQSSVERLVLVSSFSVYDWRRGRFAHDERAPLLEKPSDGGAYAAAKRWQERLADRAAGEHGWRLTVLRPGFIWGRGNDDLDCIGQRVGRWFLVFGPRRRLPLTHVTNCADAILRATEDRRAIGEVFDVVDGLSLSAGRYARLRKRHAEPALRLVPVPHFLARLLVRTANLASRIVFGPRGKLPSFFTPVRFALRYRPLRFRNRHLREQLEWSPPLDVEACVGATWGPEPARTAPRREAA